MSPFLVHKLSIAGGRPLYKTAFSQLLSQTRLEAYRRLSTERSYITSNVAC